MGIACASCSEPFLSGGPCGGLVTAGSAGGGGPRPVRAVSSSATSVEQARSDVQLLKRWALRVSNYGRIDDFYGLEDASSLGEGAFGLVVRCQDKRTKQWHAVKSILKSAVDSRERLQEEVAVMQILDHPNIVRLLESFEDTVKFYLVTELCEGGELFDRLCEEGHFTEANAASLLQQMLLAVNYLHQNCIIHRDLKPQNWLLKKRSAMGSATLKLIDFGISRRFGPEETLRSKVGTPPYFAPEVLDGCYTCKADLWSIGVIAWILISGEMPFSGKTLVTLIAQVKGEDLDLQGRAWAGISVEGRAFVRALMERSPQMRPSAADALQREWLQERSSAEGQLSKIEVGRLKAFGKMHNMKKAALTVMATQLEHKQVESLRQLFISMDRNQDGTLSAAEMKQGFQVGNIPIPRDLEKLLDQVDTDGSGTIEYTEFLAATLQKKFCHQEDIVWKAFRRFDKDGSGSIDSKELVNVFGDEGVQKAMHLDGGHLQELMASVDTNGDGLIDFHEFFAMLSDGGRPKEAKPAKYWSTGMFHSEAGKPTKWWSTGTTPG